MEVMYRKCIKNYCVNSTTVSFSHDEQKPQMLVSEEKEEAEEKPAKYKLG